MEDLVFSTLGELEKSTDDTIVIFDDLKDTLDDEYSSYSNKKEEQRDENMVNQYLDWMA